MKNIFVVEHLEKNLGEWCFYEYENISKIIGAQNLFFTNVKKEDAAKLKKFGKVFNESVKDLNLKSVCVLDPEAEKTLTFRDMRYKHFIFGGILGDYPSKKRTAIELTKFLPRAEKRNIGKAQLATDNAVYVVKEILSGKKLNEIDFVEIFELRINKIESIELPFRYVLVNGKPLISRKITDYLKKHRGF